jgi:RNA polymerase sigma-70 factor (ECF subfamily)
VGGDEDERGLWFRREVIPLEPMLRAYARRFSDGSPAGVEDLVHETFAQLIGFAGWRGIDNVAAFAVRTLRNEAFKIARRSKIVSISVMSDLDSLGVADDLPGAERMLEARDELRLLARLIADLPPQCRRVFTLRKVYGLSHEEIAVRLGLSISTIEKHVIKGLRLCSERLAREPARGWRTGARRVEKARVKGRRRCAESE